MSGPRHWSFPLRRDSRGQLHDTDGDEHVRDLLEQLLFTVRGERVDRPDFGTLLPTMLFTAASPEHVASLRNDVLMSIQRWLGDRVEVVELDVRVVEESRVGVSLTYRRLDTGTEHRERFER